MQQVHAQRGHTGDAVVGQRVQRTREDVVEASQHHVCRLDPLRHDVDADHAAQVVRGRYSRADVELLFTAHFHVRGRVHCLFDDATAGRDLDRVEIERLHGK